MANQRLRPGPWSLVNGSSSTVNCQIDYEQFDIPANGTIEFQVFRMGIYDDTNLTPFRTPPTPQTSVSNLGEVESVKSVKKVKYEKKI